MKQLIPILQEIQVLSSNFYFELKGKEELWYIYKDEKILANPPLDTGNYFTEEFISFNPYIYHEDLDVHEIDTYPKTGDNLYDHISFLETKYKESNSEYLTPIIHLLKNLKPYIKNSEEDIYFFTDGGYQYIYIQVKTKLIKHLIRSNNP